MRRVETPPEESPRVVGAWDVLSSLPSSESGMERHEIESLASVPAGEVPTVLLLSEPLLDAGSAGTGLDDLPAHVTVVAADEAARRAAEGAGRLFLHLPGPDAPVERTAALEAAARHSTSLLSLGRTARRLERAREELRELNRIGMALMSERDPDRLLGLILTQARRLTGSDAGSLYLVEEDEDGRSRLRFLRAQNASLPEMPDPDFTLPLDRTSLAGYAALTGEPLVIEDAYEIPDDEPYSFNRSFDETHGYRAKSMLVAPMIDHRDRVVGVIQLINRKADPEARIRSEGDAREHVRPYTGREVELARSLAGQAAVSIENGRLYRDIENLFEGFVKAAVTAIDKRDPTTSGHSVRVTELTIGLAEVVNARTDGRFADVRFSDQEMKELRYSGLLHDFGKIAVGEEVLVKRKKLPPELWARLEARFQRIRDLARARYQADRAAYLEEHGEEGYDDFLSKRNVRLDRELERIDRYWDAIVRANEPRVLPEEGAEILEEIRGRSAVDPTGTEVPLLTGDELHYLRIPRGSLDEEEVRRIQSHVMHGYQFLQEIPWTEELGRVDEIMLGHHEKLDGSGYPRGVGAEEIPLKTRMMAVADIFDALTASDRPYKDALSVERALEILRVEADEGALDPDLVALFVEEKVYERVTGVDWRDL